MCSPAWPEFAIWCLLPCCGINSFKVVAFSLPCKVAVFSNLLYRQADGLFHALCRVAAVMILQLNKWHYLCIVTTRHFCSMASEGLQCWSVGPPLWSRLKYLNYYWMVHQDIFDRHSLSPEVESCWLWWSTLFYSIDTIRLTFAILSEMAPSIGLYKCLLPSGWNTISLVIPRLFFPPASGLSSSLL